MSRKFLTNIDLSQNQLLNALLEVVAGNPSSPANARVWYDSTNNTVKCQINGVTIDLLARSTHTGTQTAATISDFTTAVDALKWSSMAVPTASVPMNAQKLTGLGAGSASGDSVEYTQFQTALANITAGMSFKLPVKLVSIANIATLSGTSATIDGSAVVAGDRVLLSAQTTASQNGIWLVGSGAWVQVADNYNGGDCVTVDQGSTYHDTLWMLTTNGAITVGTTAQAWTQFGQGVAYTAATSGGLSLAGTAFSAVANTGVTVSSSGVGADFSVVGRKFVGTFTGNGTTTSFSVTHNLNNVAPVWSVYSGTQQFDLEFQPSSANAGSFVAVTAPPSGTYNYTLIG